MCICFFDRGMVLRVSQQFHVGTEMTARCRFNDSVRPVTSCFIMKLYGTQNKNILLIIGVHADVVLRSEAGLWINAKCLPFDIAGPWRDTEMGWTERPNCKIPFFEVLVNTRIRGFKKYSLLIRNSSLPITFMCSHITDQIYIPAHKILMCGRNCSGHPFEHFNIYCSPWVMY